MNQVNFRRAAALLIAICIALSPPAGAQEEQGGGGASPPKYVALTFDDGPSGEITQQLLDGLAERYVSVTFFLCGYRIEQYPELVKRMSEDGHELGIHGYCHKCMQKMTQDEAHNELEETSFLISEITGTAPRLFRPPGGLIGDALLSEAKREDLPIILWSVDPEDWRCHEAARVTNYICRHVKDGDIILMHDMCKSSVTAALRVVDTLQEQGWQFITVSELAAIRETALQPAECYRSFPA